MIDLLIGKLATSENLQMINEFVFVHSPHNILPFSREVLRTQRRTTNKYMERVFIVQYMRLNEKMK